MTKEITNLTEKEVWTTLDKAMENCSNTKDVDVIGSLIIYVMDKEYISPNGKNIFDYQFEATKLAKKYAPAIFSEEKNKVQKINGNSLNE
ncbi:hypothetical protein KAI04_04690 [Candidatus Pacearchaeota archaeon]|nr:hypothetical protein [Candidatus Pacearchaeota archaeon]